MTDGLDRTRRMKPGGKRTYLWLCVGFAGWLVLWNASVWTAPTRSLAYWEYLTVTFSMVGLITTIAILFCARFLPIVVPSELIETEGVES